MFPSNAVKRSPIEISGKLLDIFRTAGHNPWKSFVTGDKSYFYLQPDHERICFEHEDVRRAPANKLITKEFGLKMMNLGLLWIESLPP
jgi:hypothetical protein